MAPVPLFSAPPVSGTNPVPTRYPIEWADGKLFKVYTEGQESGLPDLPTFMTGQGGSRGSP